MENKKIVEQLADAEKEILYLRDLVDIMETDRENRAEYDELMGYVMESDDPKQLAEEWWEDKLELKQLRKGDACSAENKLAVIQHHIDLYVEREGVVPLREALQLVMETEVW